MRTREELEERGRSGYGAVVAGVCLEAILDCRDILIQLQKDLLGTKQK